MNPCPTVLMVRVLVSALASVLALVAVLVKAPAMAAVPTS